MKHFLLFGTHPDLSRAESEAVLGCPAKAIAGEQMAIYTDEQTAWDGGVLQARLAGITKLGDILFEMPLSKISLETLAEWTLSHHQAGKILFGFTVYGGSNTQQTRVEKCALPFKRLLQASQHPVRWVTGKEGALTPAAVDKLNLTQEGYDFVFGIVDQTVYIGRTTHVQDATAWSTRDYGRPFRDTKTGMLPPKLARLMINLGSGTNDPARLSLLDPFCGGGTVMMEAALLGVGQIIGSDIDERQIDGSKQNLDWLVEKHIIAPEIRSRIILATTPVQEIQASVSANSIDTIVTEGYLGHPLQGNETIHFLTKQKQDIEQLWFDALSSCAHVHRIGGRAICIWPSFMTKQASISIDLTSRIAEIGYKKLNTSSLVYGRDDQHVKRQVVILERI